MRPAQPQRGRRRPDAALARGLLHKTGHDFSKALFGALSELFGVGPVAEDPFEPLRARARAPRAAEYAARAPCAAVARQRSPDYSAGASPLLGDSGEGGVSEFARAALPDTLVVHFVRDLRERVVSEFLYHRRAGEGTVRAWVWRVRSRARSSPHIARSRSLSLSRPRSQPPPAPEPWLARVVDPCHAVAGSARTDASRDDDDRRAARPLSLIHI